MRALFTSERRDLVPHSQVRQFHFVSALYFVHRLPQANMKSSTKIGG
jgi:hypothetical protein